MYSIHTLSRGTSETRLQPVHDSIATQSMVELLWLRRTVRAEKPQAVEGLVFDVDRLDVVEGGVWVPETSSFKSGCLVKQAFFYVKNWNHPIETTTNKWMFEAPWAPIP